MRILGVMGSGHAKCLTLREKCHKDISKSAVIDRFSAKIALLRESTKNEFDYKHDLIPLLSDEDHRMAEAYGVWIEKKMLKSSTELGRCLITFVAAFINACPYYVFHYTNSVTPSV